MKDVQEILDHLDEINLKKEEILRRPKVPAYIVEEGLKQLAELKKKLDEFDQMIQKKEKTA